MAVHQRKDIENSFVDVMSCIFKNTLLPNQFLLLIDGPISFTFENKIKEIKKKYSINIFQTNSNIGLAKILNKGLELVNTEWVIRVDGDDLSHQNRFKTIIEAIDDNVSIISSYITEFDEFNRRRVKKLPLTHDKIIKFLKFRNPINHNAVAYKRLDVLSVGGYPDIFLKEDYGLWILMFHNQFKAKNLPVSLVDVNFDNNTISRRGGIKNIKSDILISKLLYKYHFINILELFIICFIRIAASISPSIVRKLVYQYFLRKT